MLFVSRKEHDNYANVGLEMKRKQQRNSAKRYSSNIVLSGGGSTKTGATDRTYIIPRAESSGQYSVLIFYRRLITIAMTVRKTADLQRQLAQTYIRQKNNTDNTHCLDDASDIGSVVSSVFLNGHSNSRSGSKY